jgi:hypothetical protein
VWRRAVLLIAVGVIAAACTPTAEPATTTTTTEPPVASSSLVISTADGAIVILDEAAIEVARFEPSDGSILRQPTWLDESTVVFSEISETGDHSLIAGDTESGEIEWASEMDSSPFFFDPAPDGSDYVTTSLRNNPQGGLLAELIDADGVATLLGDDSPFYTSWSPDGDRIAINLPGDHLEIWMDGEVETILQPAGGYQAPVWLESGLVVVRDVDGVRFLSIWDGEKFKNIARIEGSAAFVGRGNRIAIKTNGGQTEPDAPGVRTALRIQDTPMIPTNELVVVDIDTGRIQSVTDEPTAVFQLDPSGERLLYAEASLEVGLTWLIWDEGTTTEVAGYRPNLQWVGELVPFFDQYAQSVQFWSDSGEFVAFPASVDGQPVVIVYNTTTATETTIEDATWSSWATIR